MSPARQKQLVAVAALAAAAGVVGVIAFGGIEENLVYFWNVQELLDKGPAAYGATVRLGGVVKPGSHQFDKETLDLGFTVAMSAEAAEGVRVQASGQPPQMFREGIGVVVEGRYDGKVFRADRVMVKHSNEYKPPAPGEKPQDVYRTLLDGS